MRTWVAGSPSLEPFEIGTSFNEQLQLGLAGKADERKEKTAFKLQWPDFIADKRKDEKPPQARLITASFSVSAFWSEKKENE